MQLRRHSICSNRGKNRGTCSNCAWLTTLGEKVELFRASVSAFVAEKKPFKDVHMVRRMRKLPTNLDTTVFEIILRSYCLAVPNVYKNRA